MSENEYEPIIQEEKAIDTNASECYVIRLTAAILISMLSILEGVAHALDTPDGVFACICFILGFCCVIGVDAIMHLRSSIKSECPLKVEIQDELKRLRLNPPEISNTDELAYSGTLGIA